VTTTIDGCGLQLSKRLFKCNLQINDDLLCYRLNSNVTFCYASAIQNLTRYSEADLEKNIFPPGFWDGVNMMVSQLKDKLFDTGVPNFCTTWKAYITAREDHIKRPTRETLLLLRTLQNFIESENLYYQALRKEKNRKNQKAYEKLFYLARSAPHSLNVLRSTKQPLIVEKLFPNHWRITVTYNGKEFTEWSSSPILAAAKLARHEEINLYQINFVTKN